MTISGAAPALVPAADVAHALGLLDDGAWEGLRGKRIFVTGGTGFVGKWMLSVLLEADRRHALGVSLVLLSRDPEAFRAGAPSIADASSVQLLRGDVRDFRPSGVGQVDAVIHAATDVVAASRPLDTFDTCVTGTRRVLDLAVRSGACDFLLVSSGAVYGHQPVAVPSVPESFTNAPDSLAPTSAYGLGKRACEWLVSTYAAEHGLRCVIARCFAFVGPLLPLDKQFAIGNFMRDALAGGPVRLQGDGSPIRSYLHAADMTGWLWRIFFDGRSGSAYNVGSSEAVSMADLAHRVSRLLGSDAPVVLARDPVPGASINRYVPDTRLAHEEFGLPEPIALDDAILRTAHWLRQPRAGVAEFSIR